jgi:hypothetical protein
VVRISKSQKGSSVDGYLKVKRLRLTFYEANRVRTKPPPAGQQQGWQTNGLGAERGVKEGAGTGRTGDGVEEVAVDEELGEPDLHLGHLEPLLAAPVRIHHAAGRGEMRGVWLTWLRLGLGEWCAAERSEGLFKGEKGRGQLAATDGGRLVDLPLPPHQLSFFFFFLLFR